MNVVLIVGDRHNPEFTGCYGNPITRTPQIDSIAERGTRFENAYCHSPLCVPARAAMMSGRYVHETGTWDNAFPYTGVPRGWGHYFAEQGVHLTTTGKVDYAPGGDHGIAEERLAVHREKSDIHSLFREQEIPRRYHHLYRLRAAGPAEMTKERSLDVRVAEDAATWIAEKRPSDRPWILIANFNDIHSRDPSQELWDHYDPLVQVEDLDKRYFEDLSRLHPHHQIWSRRTCADLIQPEELRRGLVGYHGVCEAMDQKVGRVLQALERARLLEKTLVIYASDHGGSCGEHRTLDHGHVYEEAIRVVFVASGPGLRSGAVVSTPVSHVDMYATICQALGLDLPEQMRGVSLMGLLRGEQDAPRPTFTLTEYHGGGMPGGLFAIRSGPYKFVECVGERSILFNLQEDPLEMHDLVAERPGDPEVEANVRRLRRMLCEVCSPEAVDARAKADQRALRRRLTESGQILDDLYRFGYERNPERLIDRPECLERQEFQLPGGQTPTC
jgi:choline-sulfatase